MTRPAPLSMRMHKNMAIQALRLMSPEEVQHVMPDHPDAASAIAALEAHPGEWIIGGELLTPEQWAEVAEQYEGRRVSTGTAIPRRVS